MGFHVVPAFVVFHRLPDPAATYQVLGFIESIATSAMRPDMKAGPMDRNDGIKSAAVSRSLSFAASFVGVSSANAVAANASIALKISNRFIGQTFGENTLG